MNISSLFIASRSSSAFISVAERTLKGDIESVRNVYFWLLLGSTAILAVGALLEEIEHFWHPRRPHINPENGEFVQDARRELRATIARIGFCLVIIGIIGEGVFEGYTSSADDILQEYNGTLSSITALQLEIVETKRAQVEKSLINLEICNAPRVFAPWTINGVPDNRFDSLKPFATEAIIEFIPDFEARRAALNLKWALGKAGWNVTRINSAGDIDDGIDAQTFVPPGVSDPKERDSLVQAEHRSENAADAVVNLLRVFHWQANRGWPGDEIGRLDTSRVPPGGLLIRIGLFPAAVYEDRELAAAEAKSEHDRQASIKEAQDKRDKEREEGLTGKDLEDFRAELARSRAVATAYENEYRKKYSNPCQLLNPVSR